MSLLARGLACAVAALLVALAAFQARPAGSAVSAHADCPPYLVIGSRGSGADKEKFGGMGEESWAFYRRFADLVPGAAYHANDYPAVGVFTWPWNLDFALQITNAIGAGTKLSRLGLGAYHDSAVDGTRSLTSLVRQTIRECGAATKILLAGHSQGAQVTADVLQRELGAEERTHILGVVLFGDPYFNPLDGAARGHFSVDRTGLLGTRELFPSGTQGKVLSYCHEHDPICQGVLTKLLDLTVVDPQALTFGQHTNYADHGEPEEAAEYFARLSGAFDPPPRDPLAPPCVTPRRVGVVFVIDDSGSMYDENDKNGLRFDAATLGLQLLPVGSEAAVVKFSTNAQTVFQGPVDSGIPSRGSLALAGGTARGYTHYDKGLGVAEGLLRSSSFSAPDRLAVIFFSDGLPNGGDYTEIRKRIAARGIPIFAVGLGAASRGQGLSVLEELAAPNNGDVFLVPESSAVNELTTVFARIIATVNCDDPRAVDTKRLPAATTQGFGTAEYPITVKQSDAQLVGVVTWQLTGQVRVSLRRSDGSVLRLGSERPGEIVRRGRVEERFEVSDPALPPGVWTLRVENTSRDAPVRVSLAVFGRRLGEPLPTAPRLKSPIDEARVPSSTVLFQWEPAARAVSYDVLVDGRLLGHVDARTELEIADLEAGTHEWRMRAYNSSGAHADSGSEVFVVTALDGRPHSTAPVIFLPGIMGSRLFCENGKEVWPALTAGGVLKGIARLRLAPDGESPADGNDSCNTTVAPLAPELQLTGRGIIEEQAFRHIYDDAVEWLATHSALQAAGDTRVGDVRRAFVFPYDWRKSPGSASTQSTLDAFVDRVREATGADRVRFIAHSMGGLVARWYISDPGRAAKVEKLVTLGTPFWGAPASYAPLMLGDTGPTSTFDLDLLLRGGDVKTFAATSSGLYSLYPNDDYWAAIAGDGLLELQRLNGSLSSLDAVYEGGYTSEVVAGASATDKALVAWGGSRSLLGQARANSAEHLSGFETNGVNVQAVIGAGVHSIGAYRLTVAPVATAYGDVEIRAVEFLFANGDGTVPARSAAQGVWWAAPKGDDVARRYVCGTRHGDLVRFKEPLTARADRDGGRIAAAVYPFVFGNAGDVLALEDPGSRECRAAEPDANAYFQLPGFRAGG